MLRTVDTRDLAGKRTALADPLHRTTSGGYDAARLTAVSAWHVPYPCPQSSGTMRTVMMRGLPSWRQGKEGHGCCRAR